MSIPPPTPDPQSGPSSGSGVPGWLGKKVGRFKLLGLLGRGAYGRVFLAEDVDLHRRVALKVVTADAAAKAVRREADAGGLTNVGNDSARGFGMGAVEQLIREARAAARLEHPNIVTIFEVGQLPVAGASPDNQVGGGYIAMELAEGGTLQELVNAAGPMDVRRACTVIAEAADALQFAHALGVLHRDVKPANLMLTRNGRVKVADFGLAYIEDPGDGHQYSRLVGTPAYIAPEMVVGNPASARSDQYSLGATLFTLLAGRPPYVGDRKAVLDAHVNRPPPSLSAVRPDVDAKLEAVLHRAMSKNPDERFDTIGTFGKALRLFTIGDDGSAAITPLPAVSRLSTVRAALEVTDGDGIPTGPALDPMTLTSMLDSASHESRRRSRRVRHNVTVALVTLAVIGGIAALVVIVGQGDDEPVATITPPPPPPPASPAPESARSFSDDALDDSAPAELAADRQNGSSDRAVPPPPAEPDGAISALELDRLIAIANGVDPQLPSRRATVTGRVSFARTSETGNVFRVYFEDSRHGESFAVVWFPDDFARMQTAFGGENGSGLLNKRIAVTGIVEVYRDQPQIVIDNPSQIEVLSE